MLPGAAAVAAMVVVGAAGRDTLWRRLQLEERRLERAVLVERLATERRRLAAGTEERLAAAVERERQRLAGAAEEVGALEEEIAGFEGKARRVSSHLATARAALAASRERQQRAVALGRPAEAAAAASRVERLGVEVRERRKELEGFTELAAERRKRLEELRAGFTAAAERRDAELAPSRRLEEEIARLDPGVWRLVPLLDPAPAIREVAPEDVVTVLPEGRVPRLDRCPTCHLVADRPGFAGEDRAEPLRTHPRLDLFLGAASPHPLERVGCTVCHGGEGRATGFAAAGHRPRSEAEAAAWRERWGWRPPPPHVAPILPGPLAEAGCAACHRGEGWTPEAPRADLARELTLRLGCYGCHPADDPMPKPGPSLRDIAAKTTPAWAYRWIEAPRSFRQTTWMPAFFEASEGSPEARQRRTAEIVAMVSYLWHRSEQREGAPVPEGDPAVGAQLFAEVGCAACHLRDAAASRAAFFDTPERLQGPNLAKSGSKLRPAWLYSWLRAPRSHRPDTPMPDFRLDERQAADLVACLAADRDPAWEGLTLPEVDPATRDALVRSYLEAEGTLEEAAARLEAMGEEARSIYLGERTLARYGCYGCHDIPGFEEAPPVAGSLDAAGAEPLVLYDFGHGTDRAAASFLRPPAGWPARRGIRESEPAPRPDYGLGPRETRTLLVELLGRKPSPVAADARADRRERTAELAAGRRLLSLYNCRGCHMIEGRGGAAGGVEAAASPSLAAEGARVRSAWLFAYLDDPGAHPVRPWLTARMPSYGLSADERNALVRYFTAREGRLLLAAEPPPATPQSVAVGEVVYAMLQCDGCHLAGSDEGRARSRGAPAPPYEGLRQRLRPEWVVAWILDPQRWIPGTVMPGLAPGGGAAPQEASFVASTIDAPMFSRPREELLERFSSEEELHAYLANPARVAAALRDYLWSVDR